MTAIASFGTATSIQALSVMAGVGHAALINAHSREIERDSKINASVFSVLDYGATGLGIADDTAAIQAAFFDARLGGGVLYFPAGRYRITSTITGLTTLDGGPTVDADYLVRGAGRDLVTLVHDFPTGPMFSISGALSSTLGTMSSGAVIGATQIAMTSTTGIAKGDILWLRDPANIVYGNSTRVQVAAGGEVVRVRSVDDSTHVTLYGPLNWVYGVTSDVRRLGTAPYGLGTAPRVRMEGFRVENPSNVGDTSSSRAVLISYCQEVVLRDIDCHTMAAAALYVQGTAGFYIDNCRFYDGQDDEVAISPYGIVAGRGSSHGLISNCSARYGRHLFTTTTGDTEIPPQHVQLVNCISTGHASAAFDTHPGARWISFVNCRAIQTAAYGFQVRGPDSSVIDCTVIGSALAAVYFAHGADRGRIHSLTVDNAPYGVLMTNSDDLRISGNTVLRSTASTGVTGVYMQEPGAEWAGHVTKFEIDDTKIEGYPQGIRFNTDAWVAGMRIGPGTRVIGATDSASVVVGTTAPAITAAGTVTVPA